jgi:hypothetical protein
MKAPLYLVKIQKYFSFFVCLFVVLGFEFRAYTLNHSTSPFFVLGVFEIGSCELFAEAGFKP